MCVCVCVCVCTVVLVCPVRTSCTSPPPMSCSARAFAAFSLTHGLNVAVGPAVCVCVCVCVCARVCVCVSARCTQEGDNTRTQTHAVCSPPRCCDRCRQEAYRIHSARAQQAHLSTGAYTVLCVCTRDARTQATHRLDVAVDAVQQSALLNHQRGQVTHDLRAGVCARACVRVCV